MRCPYVLLFLLPALLVGCGPSGSPDGSDDGITVQSVDLDVPSGQPSFVPNLEGPLRPLSVTPRGSLQGYGAFPAVTVTFSKPMVPLGAPRPVDPNLLALEPALLGTLQWEGTQTLVFRPDTLPPPATLYRATLRAGLTALDGDRLDEPYSWTFETPRPRLVASEPSSGSAFVDPRQTVELRFNQAVQTQNAAPYLALFALPDYQTVPTTVTVQSDSVLLVRPDAPLAQGASYVLIIEPGLPSARGALGVAEEERVSFSTYPAPAIERVVQQRSAWEEIETDFDPASGITVHFATPVRFEALREALTITPAVEMPPGLEARDDVVSTSHWLPFLWAPETNYTLAVDSLVDPFGQILVHDESAFSTKAYTPAVYMAQGLMVIEAEQTAAIPLRVTNVESVRLGTRTFAADEIIPALTAYDPWRSYDSGLPAAEAVPPDRDLPLSVEPNTPTVVPLRLDSLLNGATGVVGIHVVAPPRPGEDAPVHHNALAQVTRLGLTAKFSPFQNLAFVTELDTAVPVPEARVTVRDAANRVLWSGTTDADGRVTTPGWATLGIEAATEWTVPTQFLFVEKDNDLAFTSNLFDEGIEPYRFGLNYDWRPDERTYAGSVFSDRGLYRTGETLHLKGILREKTDADWSAVTDSVRLLIVSPRDQQILDRRLLPGDLGTIDLQWDIPAHSDLGYYTVRVALAGDTMATERSPYEEGDLAQGSFQVEAFRRATFDVRARSTAPGYVAGDFFEGTLSGRYLFGAPMSGQPARYTLQREAGSYVPPGFDTYRFGRLETGDGLYQLLAQADTVLNEDGELFLRTTLPGNEEGVATTLRWGGSVTDPADQEGYGGTERPLHPGLFYIGLKPQTTFLDLSASSDLTVDLITVDPAGRPVAADDVEVTLIRRQWNSVREVGEDGRLRWRSERIEEEKAHHTLDTEAGKARRLTLPVAEGGRYVIRATGRDLRGNVIRSEAYLYAAGSGYVAWQRADEDRIEVIADRETYRPGDTARLIVQSPYEEATALITVEREGILSSRVETLVGSAPQVSVPITEAHLPNIFVSVILLSGRTAPPSGAIDPGAPGFKIGYTSLGVDAGHRHLAVDVIPDADTYSPGDEVTIDFQLRDADGNGVPGEITFSAADAGVLNLIGYTLPDPFDTFYGPRPLGVTTSQTLSNLVRQRNYGQKEEDEGGGGGDGAAGDRIRSDFRPLAHWEPSLQTDQRGRARLTFRLPESLTTFRLMATALTAENAFGAGQTDVTVTKPLVLQPALPRFARTDDRFEAGVLVTNSTGEAGVATVAAQGDGLSLSGEATQTVALGAGETRVVRFDWTTPAPGAANVTFSANLGTERDALTTSFPVQLPVTRYTAATFASTTDPVQERLDVPDAFLPGVGGFRVRLASTALTGLEGAAEYLFMYPYGCLEQRTSRIRPLIAGDALLEVFDVNALGGDRDRLVQEWLDGLREFWIDGGFTFWPGGTRVNPYVSAYVILALAEARSAGFALPEQLTEEAVDALAQMVRNPNRRPEYFSEAVWTDTRTLMLYALARHGRFLEPELNALAQQAQNRPDAVSTEGRSLLLRAVALSGLPALQGYVEPLRASLERQIRVESTQAYLSAPEADPYQWIFASDTRATAFGLTALLETGPAEAQEQLAARMIRYLIAAREGGHWASTQENAAVVEAFHTYYEAYEQTPPDFTAEVLVAGQSLLRESFEGRALSTASAEVPLSELPSDAPVNIEIEKSGAGRLYYTLTLDTYGTAPVEALDQGLRVVRRMQRLDPSGIPAGDIIPADAQTATFTSGDLIQVTLRLTSPTDRHYVVVDDALPAGLEALNAAFLTTNPDLVDDTGSDRWWGSFNHVELRDDRVVLFADYLTRGEHTYTYVARATTPGTFVHPPVEAALMYKPEIMGRTASGTLTVNAAPDDVASR